MAKRNASVYPVGVILKPKEIQALVANTTVNVGFEQPVDNSENAANQTLGRQNARLFRKSSPWTSNDTSGATLLATYGSTSEPPPPPPTYNPNISISAPSGGSTVSGTITITASLTGPDASATASVAFYVNNILVSTDSSVPFSASFNTNNISNGSASIHAIATSTSGLTQQSSTVTINVNNTAPSQTTGSITSPANGSNVSGTALNWTTSASDPSGIQKVEMTLKVGNGSTTVFNTELSAPYDGGSLDTTQYPNGTSLQLGAIIYPNSGSPFTVTPVTVTVQNAVEPPPDPGGGGGTLIFTQVGQTISWSAGSRYGFGEYRSIPGVQKNKTNGVRDFEVEYNVTFPSNFEWRSFSVAPDPGFKMPGPGGSDNNFIPNGCDQSTRGWSARLQAEGQGDRALVCGYPYLQTTPPSRSGLSINNTNCGIVVKPTGAAATNATMFPGNTYNIKQRILMNTDNSANGRMRISVNNVVVIYHDALLWSNICQWVDTLVEQFYFGGSSSTSTSPKSQNLTYSNITIKNMAGVGW